MRIADWSAYARDAVAGVRFAVGTGRLDPGVEPLLEDLRVHCGDFAAWWGTHDVLDQEVTTRTFRHRGGGLRRLDLLTVRAGPAVARA